MTHRENVLSLLKRQGYAWAPVEFTLCPYLFNKYKEKTGDKEGHVEEYFDFDIRNVYALPLKSSDDAVYRSYYDFELKQGTHLDAYGVAHEPGSEEAKHMTRMRHPMEKLTSIEAMMDYPFPEVDSSQFSKLKKKVEHIQSKGYAVAGGNEATIWERSWYLRSMPELMCDMLTGDEMATYLLDKVTEIAIKQCDSLVRSGIDILRIGDDIGMQSRILMSHELYTTWIKPRLQQVIASAKAINPELLVQYHSCGYILPFIGDLIEVGVDILNPVQPESMDFDEIHEKYGDRLSFHGTVGTQTTMPYGTPDEVKEVVKRNLDIAGEKGGLLCAPTHLLEPEVPWENIEAYVEACKTYKG